MSHEGNYNEYRKLVISCTTPCVPYVGIYLTDLTFIEENPDTLFGNLVNFEKRNRIGNTIENIQMKQKQPYNIPEVPEIQGWIKKKAGKRRI